MEEDIEFKFGGLFTDSKKRIYNRLNRVEYSERILPNLPQHPLLYAIIFNYGNLMEKHPRKTHQEKKR